MKQFEVIMYGLFSIMFVAAVCFLTLIIAWVCKKEIRRSFVRYSVLFGWLFSITAIVTGVSGYILSDSFYKTEYYTMEVKTATLEQENERVKNENEKIHNDAKKKGITVINLPVSFSGTFYEGSQFTLNDVEFAIIPEQYTVNETKTILGKKGGKLKLTISKVNTPSFKRDSMGIVATYTPPKKTVSHTPNKSQSRSGENWYSESDITLAR